MNIDNIRKEKCMQIIKIFFLFMIFITSSSIGYIIANQYSNRVADLQEIQTALNMFKTKMRYTYETIPDIFQEISKTTKENISEIFKQAVEIMNNDNENAGQAWRKAIIKSKTNFTEEDKTILYNMEKLLGKTDLEGQVGEIELTTNLLKIQKEKAEKEKSKNERLYKTLGSVVGATIVILLI